MNPARELAQLLERMAELVARRVEQTRRRRRVGGDLGPRQPQLQRQRDQPLLRAVVQIALQAAALGQAGQDQPLARVLQLGHAGAQLGGEALVLQGERGGARGGAEQLGLLRERRVVHDRADLLAVALQERHAGGGQRGRVPLGVDPRLASRPAGEAVGSLPRRSRAGHPGYGASRGRRKR